MNIWSGVRYLSFRLPTVPPPLQMENLVWRLTAVYPPPPRYRLVHSAITTTHDGHIYYTLFWNKINGHYFFFVLLKTDSLPVFHHKFPGGATNLRLSESNVYDFLLPLPHPNYTSHQRKFTFDE